MIFAQVVDTATRPGLPQYFLITPKLLSGLNYNEATTVLCVFNGPHHIAQQEFDQVWVFPASSFCAGGVRLFSCEINEIILYTHSHRQSCSMRRSFIVRQSARAKPRRQWPMPSRQRKPRRQRIEKPQTLTFLVVVVVFFLSREECVFVVSFFFFT